MKTKLFLKILIGIVTLLLLIKLLTIILIEPWVGNKIQSVLNEKNRDFIIKIEKVHILMLRSVIKLEIITINSKEQHAGRPDFKGEIASIKFKGIKFAKALFKKDIDIRELTISNICIKGKILFPKKAKPPIVSPLNIRIGNIFFDKIDLAIGNTSTAQAYTVKEGVLKVYDLQVKKQDTINLGIIKQLDFEAEELLSVSSDSMYTYKVSNIVYSSTSKTIAVKDFSINPNYSISKFTALHKFATDRIKAQFSNMYMHDFSPAGYLKSRSLISSYIEIGKMDLNVFRDCRKEFQHINKPAYQDMIYNYPGSINIDSIGVTNGNITYTEHAEKAKEPGSISFNEINAKIYNITNDTIYKTKTAFLELKGKALLMGKGEMTILLKGRIYDSYNTFSLNGTLSGMEAKGLNPMLEKNAFIYITSGKIDALHFSFNANNTKATGNMTLLYHGLEIANKNKQTDKTNAYKEQLISLIVNKNLKDSNPIPGEKVRKGIIDNKRDPEKFLFGYCWKSILSGIISSLAKSPK